MTISATGDTNEYYELDLVVDPGVVDKVIDDKEDDDDDDDGVPAIIIMGISIAIAGALGGVLIMFYFKKKGLRPE